MGWAGASFFVWLISDGKATVLELLLLVITVVVVGVGEVLVEVVAEVVEVVEVTVVALLQLLSLPLLVEDDFNVTDFLVKNELSTVILRFIVS